MVSQLPPEILKNVFQEIHGQRGCYRSGEQLNDLYSCLLVNKRWCQAVVPILWSAPFYPIQTIRMGTITTYLSCLGPKERQTLQHRAGINIPVEYDRPAFEYPSHLTELSFDKFLKTIIQWCKTYRKPCRITKRNELIIRSLLELFSSKRANIKYFAMNNVPSYRLHDDYFDGLRTIDFKLLAEPCIRDCLSGVKELRLEWDALALDGLLTALGHTCHSLEIIDANFAHIPEAANLSINKQQAEELAVLISNQKSLQRFNLQNYRYYTQYFIDSLRTQTRSLKRIEFYSIDFCGCISFEVFKHCTLLSDITFEDCIHITVDMVKPLFNAPFPNLKRVHVRNDLEYYDPPCEELVGWADKKNSKGRWWENLSTIEIIRMAIKYPFYLIIFCYSIYFIVNFSRILFKHMSREISIWADSHDEMYFT